MCNKVSLHGSIIFLCLLPVFDFNRTEKLDNNLDIFAGFPVGRRNCRLPCDCIYARLRIKTLSVDLRVVIRKDHLCI